MIAADAAHEQVLRPDGRFDLDAARAFRDALLGMEEDAHVVVDLSAVPAVDPAALAVLAACLTARHAPELKVLGLTVQQERMLRYLGVDLRADGGLGPRDALAP